MRMLWINLVSNFQMHHTAALTVVIIVDITSPSTYLSDNWEFVPSDHHPTSLSFFCLWSNHKYGLFFFFNSLIYFYIPLKVRSYRICL